VKAGTRATAREAEMAAAMAVVTVAATATVAAAAMGVAVGAAGICKRATAAETTVGMKMRETQDLVEAPCTWSNNHNSSLAGPTISSNVFLQNTPSELCIGHHNQCTYCEKGPVAGTTVVGQRSRGDALPRHFHHPQGR
jgi:hypothetical protein